MNATLCFRITALLGFLGVALGAFGAHGLSKQLLAHGTLAIWQTAVLYHLLHTVVMLLLCSQTKFHFVAWALFLAGVVIFSGSLYLLALTNIRSLGAITPIGGLGFLAGWLWLMIRPGR